MHPIRLKQKVTVRGPNLWHCDLWRSEGQVIFTPSIDKGWWWKIEGAPAVLIDPAVVDVGSKLRRARLVFGNRKMEVFEHISVLRWLGLCDLLLESTPWPPHFGRPFDFWQAVKPHCQEDSSREIKWYTVRKTVKWVYPESRRVRGFTEIRPSTDKRLKLIVTRHYAGLEPRTEEFIFPNQNLLEKLCLVPSQGWPSYLYYPLKTASMFLDWPHLESAVWIRERGREKASWDFLYHGVIDLLGALSLLCRDGLLSADVISFCSGHRADVEAVIEANKLLYCLGE